MDSTDEVRTAELVLDIEHVPDDRSIIHALRGGGGDYIDPELSRIVAEEIKRYPNSDAPQWLSPTAAILAVERWLIARGKERSPRPSR